MNQHSTARGSIVGIVSAVPSRVVRNADCPDPAAADEAAKITGVYERRWVSPGQSARTLCTAAAVRLVAALGWNPQEIDLIVYVTQTPESAVPADVFRIAADLGTSTKCVCLQLNMSCSGYVYGLWTAMRLADECDNVLLLVGDATSTIADPADRATSPLFGDAGSATAIVGDHWEELGHPFVMGSDGTGADKLCQEPDDFLRMDGGAVFNFTLKRVPAMLSDLLDHSPRPDYICFHMANEFMVKHLIKKSKLVEEFGGARIPINIGRFGNTSCASIPLLMCSEMAETLKALPTAVAMLGFGAGLAWCGATVQCAPMRVIELIEV